MAVRRGRGTCVWREDRKQYQASIRMGLEASGKRRRVTAYGKTAKDAENSLATKVLKIKSGEYRRPSKETVGAYLDAWLADRDGIKASTRTLYQTVIDRYIKPHVGGALLDRFAQRDPVRELYKRLRGVGASARNVRHVHVVLGAAFRAAVKDDRIFRNPMEGVEAPHYRPVERPTITVEDGERFLEAAKGHALYALFVLALDSGARQGELFGLRRADVDLKNRIVAIRRSVSYAAGGTIAESTTKTGRSRSVPVSVRTTDALRAHLKAHMASEYVFTDEHGRPLRKENFIRRAFHPIRDKASLPATIHFHDLRHACATRLLLQGVHPKVVAERLGHASTEQTLETYSHVVPSLGREAADLFDKVASD